MITEQSFLNEKGLAAYKDYIAIKRHFTSSYDYFKYNGSVNASYESFIARRDAYSFQRLSKIRDYKNLILANIIENQKAWIGDLLEDNANQTYLQWKKRTDSITVHIKDNLDTMNGDFKSNFIVPQNGQYPKLIDLYLQKKISLEVTTILTKITASQEYWSKTIVDKTIFPDIMTKIDNYYPFLVYSPEKIKKVVKDHFF